MFLWRLCSAVTVQIFNFGIRKASSGSLLFSDKFFNVPAVILKVEGKVPGRTAQMCRCACWQVTWNAKNFYLWKIQWNISKCRLPQVVLGATQQYWCNCGWRFMGCVTSFILRICYFFSQLFMVALKYGHFLCLKIYRCNWKYTRLSRYLDFTYLE